MLLDEYRTQVMKKEERLTKPREYSLVYSKGGSWASQLLVLRALPNELDLTRFGFSISKKVGNAVTRNRIKRRLREIVREVPVKPGWDAVFIVRSTASRADYRKLKEAAGYLLKKADILVETSADPEYRHKVP